MSRVLVLIDGYNVIMQHSQWRECKLKDARQKLLNSLNQVKWPFSIECIELIFDADESSSSLSGNICIHFAPSADTYIQTRVRSENGSFAVVSDDREIINTAKANSASVYSTKWFFSKIKPSVGNSSTNNEGDNLSSKERRFITEECERYWLREKSD